MSEVMLTREQITKRIEKAKASRERHVGMLGKYPDMQHISEAFIRCANEEIALCDLALASLTDDTVRVPREPTPEMIDAAINALSDNSANTWANHIAKIYRAMIAEVK